MLLQYLMQPVGQARGGGRLAFWSSSVPLPPKYDPHRPPHPSIYHCNFQSETQSINQRYTTSLGKCCFSFPSFPLLVQKMHTHIHSHIQCSRSERPSQAKQQAIGIHWMLGSDHASPFRIHLLAKASAVVRFPAPRLDVYGIVDVLGASAGARIGSERHKVVGYAKPARAQVSSALSLPLSRRCFPPLRRQAPAQL